jgi:hypothetical protein
MKLDKEQMKDSLEESILICETQINSLFKRFNDNKIDKEFYYREIKKWDDRLYKYQKELECI